MRHLLFRMLSTQLNPAARSSWRTRRPTWYLNLHKLIPDGIQPKRLRNFEAYHAENLDLRMPIAELYCLQFVTPTIGEHYTPFSSLVVVPRFVNTPFVLEHFEKHRIPIKNVDIREVVDQRVRIGITTNNADELANFARVISLLCPFDTTLTNILNVCIAEHNDILHGKYPFGKRPKSVEGVDESPNPISILRSKRVMSLITKGHDRYHPIRHANAHPLQAEFISAVYHENISRVADLVAQHPELLITPLGNGEDPITFSLFNSHIQITLHLFATRDQRFRADGNYEERLRVLQYQQLEILQKKGQTRLKSDLPKNPLVIHEFHDHPIHIAVKNSDVAAIAEILKVDPEAVNVLNSLYFSPAMIAAGSGDGYTLHCLLKAGAHLQYEQGYHVRSLLDCARDPKTILAVLQFKPDVTELSHRLHDAVSNGEHAVVATMLDYGCDAHFKNDYGYSPFEIAVIRAAKHSDLPMLDIFLARMDEPVMQGPFDQHLPEAIIRRFISLNETYYKNILQRESRPKIFKESVINEKGNIETWFANDKYSVKSEIMWTQDLCQDNHMMQEIFDLYTQTFGVRVPDTKLTEEDIKLLDFAINEFWETLDENDGAAFKNFLRRHLAIAIPDGNAIMQGSENLVKQICQRITDISYEEFVEFRVSFARAFGIEFHSKLSLNAEVYKNMKIAFFRETFPADPHKNTLVNISTVNGKVVSFLAFKIMEQENYVAVINKLAAGEPNLTGLGLANLNGMMFIAAKQLFPNKPVYCYYKSIPSFSWHLIPKKCELSPRHYYCNQTLMREIVEKLAGDVMPLMGITKAILVVKRIPPSNPTVEEFNRLRRTPLSIPKDNTPEDFIKQRGLAAFWEMTEHNVQAFMSEKLQPHAITMKVIQSFKICLHQFLKLHLNAPLNLSSAPALVNSSASSAVDNGLGQQDNNENEIERLVLDVDAACRLLRTMDGKSVSPEQLVPFTFGLKNGAIQQQKEVIAPNDWKTTYTLRGTLDECDTTVESDDAMLPRPKL